MTRRYPKQTKRKGNAAQDRLKKAVSYRHEPHINSPAEEHYQHTSAQSFEQKAMDRSDGRTPLDSKGVKKKKKQDWVDLMVDAPRITVLQQLKAPKRAMETIGRSEDQYMLRITAWILTALPYLAASCCISTFLSNLINEKAFSVARVAFDESCWVAMRFLLFFLIAEVIFQLLTAVMAKQSVKPFNEAKLMETEAASCAAFTAVFAVCLIIELYANMFGFVLFCIVLAGFFAAKLYGLKLVFNFSIKQLVLFTAVYAVLIAGCMLLYKDFALGELIYKFKLINS